MVHHVGIPWVNRRPLNWNFQNYRCTLRVAILRSNLCVREILFSLPLPVPAWVSRTPSDLTCAYPWGFVLGYGAFPLTAQRHKGQKGTEGGWQPLFVFLVYRSPASVSPSVGPIHFDDVSAQGEVRTSRTHRHRVQSNARYSAALTWLDGLNQSGSLSTLDLGTIINKARFLGFLLCHVSEAFFPLAFLPSNAGPPPR